MDLAGLFVFSTTLFIAAASPGPGIAAIVARVLGRGTTGAVAFTAGVAIGDVVWLTFAIVGLAALAHAFHEVFLVDQMGGHRAICSTWPGSSGRAPVVVRDVEATESTSIP